MTLVVVIPERGELRHPLRNDPDAVRRVLARLATVVPDGAVWSVVL